MITRNPQTSFLRRFSFNALSYSYGNVITLLLQFVLVPFYLRSWGASLYADWIVITGIPAMLTLLDLGVAQASNNKATVAAGAENWHNVQNSLHTAMLFSLILGGVIIFSMFCINQILNWQDLLKLKILSNQEARLIMLIMAAYLGVQLLGGPIDGCFRVLDKTAIGAFCIANRRMVDFFLSFLVLFFNGSAVLLAVTLLGGQIAMLTFLVVFIRRISCTPVLGVAQASWPEFRSILKPAMTYASFPLSQTITLQGGVQLLNQLVDASTLVGFTMARTLMRLIIQIGVVANSALKPELSRLAGQGNWDAAKQATLRMTKFMIGIAGTSYITLVIVGPQIITWWGHGQVSANSTTLALIGIHAVLNVCWFVPAALLIATNKHNRIATIYAISSITTILVWIVLSQHIPPIAGAALLLAAPELVLFISHRITANHA